MAVDIRYLADGCKLEDATYGISARINSQGYWCSFRVGRQFYRLCMDGTVVLGADAVALPEERARAVHEQYLRWINSIPLQDEVVVRNCRLSVGEYWQLAERYRAVYPEPVAILPPDRYGDIVIAPAIGCPNRQCTFCAFYRDKPYKVLSEEALVHHLASVEQLYSGKLHNARGAFLGSANAMALSQRRLVFCLDEIRERLGVLQREVGTFADPDFSARRTDGQWCELREKGLQQIVIGLETGWGLLREKLGKSGDLINVFNCVRSAKQAGMRVGITILTGVAASSLSRENLRNTMMAVSRMALTSMDMLYLSPLSDNGFVSEEAIEQQREYGLALREVTDARVIAYQMQRFRYFM